MKETDDVLASDPAHPLAIGRTPPVFSGHGGDPMNAFGEMSHDDVLKVKLEVLRREHRDLDEAIHVLEISARGDHLTLRRLKKQKLHIKDRIRQIEDDLLPDITA